MVKIIAYWQVEDGYVGGSRPQETEIEFDDEEWKSWSDEEKEERIADEVDEDFRNKISFGIDRWEVEEP